MKPTATNAIKNAVQRKLHPQLPLDRRQSQQLLDLVSSSFRQKLDQEHAATSTPTRPIDRHIQSILSNPLFRSPTSTADRPDTPNAQLSEQLAAVASPLTFFNQQAALGKATLQLAGQVLKAANGRLSRAHSLSEADAREVDEIVRAVLNWLWANGLEDSLDFLGDRRFTHAMGRLLASAGRDEVFWRWLGRLQEQSSSANDESRFAAASTHLDRLMLLAPPFLRQKFFLTQSADDAARELLKLAEHPIQDRRVRRTLLGLASGFFASRLLKLPEGAIQDATLVDGISSNKALIGAMSYGSRAVFDLFIPYPDATRAAEHLGQELVWLTQHDATPERRWHRILFSLRTIDTLIDQGRQEDALKIVDNLRKHYPQEIRSQLPKRISPQTADNIQAQWEGLLSIRTIPFSPQLN